MAPNSFLDWTTSVQQQLETFLIHHLPTPAHAPSRLHEAIRYTVLGGGKRIRPLLVLASGELAGGATDTLVLLAAAIELIHVYSLVHDDMPVMDNDTLRRGKPTCHIAFDEATALLVGDALQTLAFEWISRPINGLTPDVQLAMVQQLAHASGCAGMAGGQALDLACVGQSLTLPELERMHLMKTGALIRAAIKLGALTGSLTVSDIDNLDHFAKRIGLAFQVIDDVLDYDANTTTLGKTVGKDAASAKPTYVSLLGLSAAKHFAYELRDDALTSLAAFGSSAQRLKDLANAMVNRSF